MTFLSNAHNLPTTWSDESPPPTSRVGTGLPHVLLARDSHVVSPKPMTHWLEYVSLYTECPKAPGTKIRDSASSVGLGAHLAGTSPSGQAYDLFFSSFLFWTQEASYPGV